MKSKREAISFFLLMSAAAFIVLAGAINLARAMLGWTNSSNRIPGLGEMGAGVGLILHGIAWKMEQKRRAAAPVGLCAQCGYNLTGNVSGVCPECGKPIEPKVRTPSYATIIREIESLGYAVSVFHVNNTIEIQAVPRKGDAPPHIVRCSDGDGPAEEYRAACMLADAMGLELVG